MILGIKFNLSLKSKKYFVLREALGFPSISLYIDSGSIFLIIIRVFARILTIFPYGEFALIRKWIRFLNLKMKF